MSADVELVYLYQAWCPDCAAGIAPGESAEVAEEWATTHNAENHGDNGTNDDDYERFKEARGI